MGFTLIELMVVVAIATILFAIAIPSYVTYIRQSRRTEAKTAVLDLAGREERYLSTNPTAYTDVPALRRVIPYRRLRPACRGTSHRFECSSSGRPRGRARSGDT